MFFPVSIHTSANDSVDSIPQGGVKTHDVLVISLVYLPVNATPLVDASTEKDPDFTFM